MEEEKMNKKLLKSIYLDVEVSEYYRLRSALHYYHSYAKKSPEYGEDVEISILNDLKSVVTGVDGNGTLLKYLSTRVYTDQGISMFKGKVGNERVGEFDVEFVGKSVAEIVDAIATAQYLNIYVPRKDKAPNATYFIERVDLFDDGSFEVIIGT